MNGIKEGGSTTRPPILDGTNYSYWKIRMIAFMKSIDSKTWKVVVTRWSHPVTKTEDKRGTLKPELQWTEAEDEASLGNSRALNAIFNGVDRNIFYLINTYVSTKEAWDILFVAHKEISKVKMLRLKLLTSKFENLRMNNDESIAEFNVYLLNIANESFALGEKISEERLVRKVLRSFCYRKGTRYCLSESGRVIWVPTDFWNVP